MRQTVVEKIAEAHASGARPAGSVRTGDYVSIRPSRVMTHDNTAPAIDKFLRMGAGRVHDPSRIVFTIDHDIQNRTSVNLKKYRRIEAFAAEHGIEFHPAGSGIGHQVMVEALHVLPGGFVVAADSHANMYGAFSAVGTPVVRTDAAGIWATGEFWWRVPPSIECRLDGSLSAGASGKDLILSLCARFHAGEVLGAAVEFTGAGVASLTMDDRMTIANMTTEWGAVSGWFPADDATWGWLQARGLEREGRSEVSADPDAEYAARISVDLAGIEPHVAGPDSVQLARPASQFGEERIRIDKAYLVSCVNARESDLSAAAEVLRGKRVAAHVELYIAAASRAVEAAATRSGAWKTLLDAGARPLPPGCGPCIGLGAGILQPGEVGISATNRNFKGRMGSSRAQCYLAAPAVVAASAVAGFICAPGTPNTTTVGSRVDPIRFDRPAAKPAETTRQTERAAKRIAGFPAELRGRALPLPQDHLNTDAIYGKDFTYRDETSPAQMAAVVFRNLDPNLAGRIRPGDILVGGENFGRGSSREQAVTALQHAGVAAVVAGSFSTTYLRNAFNCGFVCLESPQLAAAIRAPKASADKGRELVVDFDKQEIRFDDRTYPFRGLDRLPQELIVSGGLENRVRELLARRGDRG